MKQGEKLRGFRNLEVYQFAFKTAVEIFNITRNFPKEEIYSLTDQIRRSSRSVAANIAEAWGKRMYGAHFISKLTDSYAEANETTTWLEFAKEHNYLTQKQYDYFFENYDHICRMLFNMMRNPNRFLINFK